MSSILPHYTHIVNPKLKHTYLSFDNEGGLVIKSPKVSSAYIETLLIKKASWIRRSQEKLSKKKGRFPSHYISGTLLYVLGRAYPLEMTKDTCPHISLTFDGTRFLVRYHDINSLLIQKHIDRFYNKEAKQVIPPLVDRWAQKMGVSPSGIRFRKTKRQWGSCSAKNTLSFNTMLIKLPLSVIEYVVVHELAHITYKHHQNAFWELVELHLPDYRERRSILQEYSTT
jgi:predicted metal-dependent hydrolase